MATEVKVQGLDEFLQAVKEHEGKKNVFALFSGATDPSTGVSWCPDCVTAVPVVEKCMTKAPEGSVYIYCSVGDRSFWKDQNNGFRKDPRTALKSVPTLLRWGTPQRLEEGQCANSSLVEMIIEGDQ
ncbi:DgyrCDS504 [Dimorphilus gyrociliatus]|uniref:Thioredoxin domain-containing protein 17 n=1 Tax=Dimorphilus gyrociliatus TaxID=2664684 RepID=A0A7I8V4W1_9ANNE|nr:DgyrCDS504 [Dimorphilus gyrociliatus]